MGLALPWRRVFGYRVGPLAYTREAGWTIGPDGSRRELCGDTAYRWLLRETPPRAERVACPLCASPLWVAADLDTADPAVAAALAHTGWSGRITPGGGAARWAGNTRPDHLPAVAERRSRRCGFRPSVPRRAPTTCTCTSRAGSPRSTTDRADPAIAGFGPISVLW